MIRFFTRVFVFLRRLVRPPRRPVVVRAIFVGTLRSDELARAMKTAEALARARRTPSKWIN